MSFAVASRAYCAHKPNTHNNGKIVGKRVVAPSRIAAVHAAPMLLHENSSLSAVNSNLIMEAETMGGAPKPPSPASLGGTEWPVEGCIKFGVAKTPLDPAFNAEYCDPVLGHNNGKDILPNYLVGDVKFDTTTELCAVALQRISAAATGQSSGCSAAKAAESLNYFLFVEKIIDVSREEFLGPQALATVVNMMSYLSFSAATSNVLLRQHQSLAKKVTESLADSCAFEPHSIDLNMIVELNEARARAPAVLALGAHQSGAIYGRRQLALLQPMGEGSVTASQASRLLVAWSKLETKFEGFHPSNQQVAFLTNTYCCNIASSTWAELEATAGAMEGFRYVPPSTTMPLLQSICEEAINRFSSGQGSAGDTGAVLAVAQHTVAAVAGKAAAEKFRKQIACLLQ